AQAPPAPPPPPKVATAPQPPPAPPAQAPAPPPGRTGKPDAAKPDATRPEHVGPLPPVPDPALVQQSPHGPLPIVGADGRKPWQVYARPFDSADKRPRIAVMVADMGLSQAATQSAVTRLPSAVTLAFAPYAGDLQSWIAQARAAGHEAVLQLPMEPLDYPHNDPGPRALLTSLKPSDNLDRLSWLLGRFTGYVGVTNYMGSKFTASTNDVRPVLEVLAKRGLLFVDSRSSARSVATRIAADLGMPRAYNDRFLDNEASRNAIDARLEELERIALKNGAAVGIGYPYPVTIDRIAHWAPTLAAKGIALVPVSAIVDKQSE
uniref:divergent polysaccharide deacetylase family protein n=1 Tax=Desertibaculum subflavum TaxID=2268458 RepID=UPI0034D2DC25